MTRFVLAIVFCAVGYSSAIANGSRNISGVVLDDREGAVRGVVVTTHYDSGEQKTITDEDGRFGLQAAGDVRLSVFGKFISDNERVFSATDPTDQIVLKITYKFPHPYKVFGRNALLSEWWSYPGFQCVLPRHLSESLR